ncbi:T9SS type A sorting domain-containing protein [Hymenobacter persicinus]|uniref:T9SS type A sorting domain-containing protein n=1 Tax=Hymenobacter persicinus TaxID=2025506 RepID=A0A4Q5LBB5_9BACT|nr:T9SS type A sorting domain-containing protein [Hymenobacter persicinus]RYU78491.1 T9SS type A sorting domain-containing protein [Hymenobacter persicinus]
MNRLVLLSALLLGPAIAQAQSWQWATAPTGAGYARIYATATDAAGNSVVAGDFTGTITLGSTTLTSAGNRDVFVARLNSAGAFTQAVRAGGPAEDYAIDLALDASGTATVLGGFYSSAAQFGPTTLNRVGTTNGAEVFVARLSASGTWTQAVQGGSLAANVPAALALDAAGNAVVAGFFYGPSAGFGTLNLANSNPSGATSDVFVARLSASGTWTQAARAGSNADEQAEDVDLAADGSAVVVGSFVGASMGVGSFTLANADASGQTNDAFVARLGSTGTWTQAVRVGGPLSDQARRVVIDAAGNATVVGSFSSPAVSFGTIALTNADPTNGTSDVFAARFTPAGTWSQALRAGGSGSETALAVAISPNGQATVGGLFFSATAPFGPVTLTNTNPAASSADLFVARLNSAGTAWTQAVRGGGINNDAVLNLSLTSTGEATVAGIYQNSTVIGSTSLTASTLDDAFYVARTSGLTLGTHRAVAAEVLRLTPNPARTAAAFALPATPEARPVLVLDALGREVRRQVLRAGATTTTLDVTSLAPGLYVVRCGEASGRLVVE